MSTYTTFQCSVCRRTKNIIKDDVRAVPNQCTITKGCEGRLFRIGERSSPETVPSVSGLTDWYPRGQKLVNEEVQLQLENVLMSTSRTGIVTLALFQSEAESNDRTNVRLKFTQQKIEDVDYQQYLFRPATNTSNISGRDVSGKNLRFDQTAIDENRVFVRVNGVARFIGLEPDEIQLSPNVVTLNTATGNKFTVDIYVYSEKNTVERFVDFTINKEYTATADSGAWSNISFVKTFDTVGQLQGNSWWIYTSTTIAHLGTSKLRLNGVYAEDGSTPIFQDQDLSNARFLLASEPYENIDRYLNFAIDAAQLHESYALSSGIVGHVQLTADKSAEIELYPPMQLISSSNFQESSFLTDDVISTENNIPADSSITRKSGKKVIGPI